MTNGTKIQKSGIVWAGSTLDFAVRAAFDNWGADGSREQTDTVRSGRDYYISVVGWDDC